MHIFLGYLCLIVHSLKVGPNRRRVFKLLLLFLNGPNAEIKSFSYRLVEFFLVWRAFKSWSFDSIEILFSAGWVLVLSVYCKDPAIVGSESSWIEDDILLFLLRSFLHSESSFPHLAYTGNKFFIWVSLWARILDLWLLTLS